MMTQQTITMTQLNMRRDMKGWIVQLIERAWAQPREQRVVLHKEPGKGQLGVRVDLQSEFSKLAEWKANNQLDYNPSLAKPSQAGCKSATALPILNLI